MKKIKFASNMMIIVASFYIAYNIYFGWNKTPINEAEETCDQIFKYGIYMAWVIYFLPLFDVYTKFIEKHERENGK